MEILSPAGNLEKLKIAIRYGADAVYLSGQKYGLRSAADNFSEKEILNAVDFAHQRGVKVYITINAKLHNKDFDHLIEFIHFLETAGIDAVICSDLGVVELVRQSSSLKIHVSTQASVNNQYHADIFKQAGASRIVVGRELSIIEAALIKKETGLEIEMFGHGAMCMSYSGHCTLSNYVAGRDANRGGCLQNCRHHYTLKNHESEIHATFLSSKDLNSLEILNEFIKHGIDSLKIEGRMKSQLYVASSTRAYAQRLQEIQKGLPDTGYWTQELNHLPYRGYTQGSLLKDADNESIYDGNDPIESDYELAGYVIEVSTSGRYALLCKSQLRAGVEIEIMPFHGETILQTITKVIHSTEKEIELAQPGKIIWLPYIDGIEKGNVVRFNSKRFPRMNKSKNN